MANERQDQEHRAEREQGQGREVQEQQDGWARQGDPSLAAERRKTVELRVRDRQGLAWVPASELLRHANTKAASAALRGHQRAHRAMRARVGRVSVAATAGVRERVRRLGSAQPIKAGDAAVVSRAPTDLR